VIACGIALVPQWLDVDAGAGYTPHDLLSSAVWEPKDQDVASRLRARIAARPSEDPSCNWLDIAHAEATVGDMQAARDAMEHAQGCTHRTSIVGW
jgi:hypothetical protein